MTGSGRKKEAELRGMGTKDTKMLREAAPRIK